MDDGAEGAPAEPTAEAELAGLIVRSSESPAEQVSDSTMAISRDLSRALPQDRGGGDGKVICPHCWHRFDVKDILAIAQHPDLLGDPVLGENAQQRFLPSRFTPDGHAVDAYGVVCPDMACPRCRLVIPRSLAQKRPLFFSIIGSSGSGKSYLLTAMIWELRGLLPSQFAFRFGDADATSNDRLIEYERTLFLCADKEAPTYLEKTQMEGSMYDEVRLQDMAVRLPRPLMFTLNPQPHHPWYDKAKEALTQTIVLYDNAGEHFQPGMDRASDPGTQHLLRARGMFFLLDPSRDPRFRARCRSSDPQMKKGAPVEPQEVLLTESVGRVRRHLGTASDRRLDRPIIVVVTKYDIWHTLLKYPLPKPWRRSGGMACSALDLDAIGVVSVAVRHLLMQICPEVVATAELFSSKVTYLPVSALGGSPIVKRIRSAGGKMQWMLMVQPKDIKPIWAPVPMLCMLSAFGMIPQVKLKRSDRLPVATDCHLSGNLAILTVPGTSQRLELPSRYMGQAMRCPETGQWFWLPHAEDVERVGTGEEQEEP